MTEYFKREGGCGEREGYYFDVLLWEEKSVPSDGAHTHACILSQKKAFFKEDFGSKFIIWHTKAAARDTFNLTFSQIFTTVKFLC